MTQRPVLTMPEAEDLVERTRAKIARDMAHTKPPPSSFRAKHLAADLDRLQRDLDGLRECTDAVEVSFLARRLLPKFSDSIRDTAALYREM